MTWLISLEILYYHKFFNFVELYVCFVTIWHTYMSVASYQCSWNSHHMFGMLIYNTFGVIVPRALFCLWFCFVHIYSSSPANNHRHLSVGCYIHVQTPCRKCVHHKCQFCNSMWTQMTQATWEVRLHWLCFWEGGKSKDQLLCPRVSCWGWQSAQKHQYTWFWAYDMIFPTLC